MGEYITLSKPFQYIYAILFLYLYPFYKSLLISLSPYLSCDFVV